MLNNPRAFSWHLTIDIWELLYRTEVVHSSVYSHSVQLQSLASPIKFSLVLGPGKAFKAIFRLHTQLVWFHTRDPFVSEIDLWARIGLSIKKNHVLVKALLGLTTQPYSKLGCWLEMLGRAEDIFPNAKWLPIACRALRGWPICHVAAAGGSVSWPSPISTVPAREGKSAVGRGGGRGQGGCWRGWIQQQ